jgi:hypothetical protein
LRFQTPEGEIAVRADATILALGGGSWPELGSDGEWTSWLGKERIEIAPLLPSNCGFDIDWSEHFATRFAGAPIKPVVISWRDGEGGMQAQQGECVATATGIEGSLIYALSATLRDAIAANGSTEILLDLALGRSLERLRKELGKPRAGRSLSEHLRRQAGLEGVKAGLVFECVPKEARDDPAKLASWIKALPLRLLRPRPIAEAISSAGGVRFDALDGRMMLIAKPGVFCAGEMIDWEAPTGGYLLTACFASGRLAAQGAVDWLQRE